MIDTGEHTELVLLDLAELKPARWCCARRTSLTTGDKPACSEPAEACCVRGPILTHQSRPAKL
ncbi:hypothetical protein [Arthrobacter sp. JCM 19049]|uniref:hypothetical protein n=1 Tax=Arthrobacter sp. JCM 19049 TaxID=1460643 RepID=UPI000A936108|nr:hypothetical protein [Arthrobacter sp. JCM 19049]